MFNYTETAPLMTLKLHV